MAIGKTAGCITLLGLALACRAEQFTVQHPHRPWRTFCTGTMTIDETGVSFDGAKDHQWSWKYEEIQQLEISPKTIQIKTYRDRKLHFGADQSYDFTGEAPAAALYPLLREHMDQRLVAVVGTVPDDASWSVPAKLNGALFGSEGTLAFGTDTVVFSAPGRGASRTWRYADIDNLSSGDLYGLAIVTREKTFHFQLKQPITETRYNDLWLTIEKKNGRIQ